MPNTGEENVVKNVYFANVKTIWNFVWIKSPKIHHIIIDVEKGFSPCEIFEELHSPLFLLTILQRLTYPIFFAKVTLSFEVSNYCLH